MEYNNAAENEMIDAIVEVASRGGDISEEQAYALAELHDDKLLSAAAAVNAAVNPTMGRFDSCSIVNARSGLCGEDCKWCAQARCYNTGCETYPFVSEEVCTRAANICRNKGIGRFSLVTSGKRMTGNDLRAACKIYSQLSSEGSLGLCASMGLLSEDELKQLWDSGVRRYHCNLETAPSHFPTLCTTHTQADKLATIAAARRLGFEICSGGIIGMGESERQRIEFALTLRSIRPASIPINILCPIKGTPLEDAAPLSEEEILRAVAIFRLVNPTVTLRFAGGRNQLSTAAQLCAMKTGVGGAIVGDLLTTLGSTVDEDRVLAASAGLRF